MLPSSWSWKVDISASFTFLEHWGAEDVLAEHELRVLSSCTGIVREVKHQRSRERSAILTALDHKIVLVLGELNVNLDKLLKELHVFFVVVDLDLSFGDVGRMRPLDRVRESVHLDPAEEGLLISCVLNKRDTELFLDGGSVAADI